MEVNKRKKLIESVKGKEKLSVDDFKKIDFINLHAHSTYSLQDAVGQVEDHFVKTIDAGHCGCCITDHGSYASFIDLQNLKKNKIGSSKVAQRFNEFGMEEHPVVMGSELYIIDDRHIESLRSAHKNEDKLEIARILNKMDSNPQWSGVFKVNPLRKTKAKLAGKELLENLESLNGEELTKALEDFYKATIKCNTYKYNHITLMAKNDIGHSNLCHLTSIASLPENFYSRPRIRFSDLLANKEGIIVTSGCFVGMIPQAINRNTGMEEEYFEIFKNQFGDDFYVEIHLTDVSYEWDKNLKEHVKVHEVNPYIRVNDRIIELVEKYDMQNNIYITQDSHMPNKEDKAIQDIVILNDPGNASGWHFKNVYYIQEIEEMYNQMRELFPHYTNEQFINWCFNTMSVLDKCRNAEVDMSLKFVTPDYDNHPVNNPVALKEDAVNVGDNKIDQYIEIKKLRKEALENNKDELIDKNLTEKNKKTIDEVEKRIEKIFEYKDYYTQKTKHFFKQEKDLATLIRVAVTLDKIDFDNDEYRSRFFSDLNTIQFNGIIALSDYFMVFEDISRLVVYLEEFKGPGRGSAAGCMVSYAIDITDIDPIKYDLLMERFLQPERVGVMNFTVGNIEIEDLNPETANFNEQLKRLNEIRQNLTNPNKDEMYYLERNLHVVDYIYELYKSGKKDLDNPNNSDTLFQLGVAKKPTGKINKSDPSMPDIDYDSSCRDLICDYAIKKYGVEFVSYIGTYGSLKVRSAIKDVLRVRKVDGRIMTPDEVNLLTKELDKIKFSEKDLGKGELHVFRMALELTEDFSAFFEKNQDIRSDVENILGTYKNMGIHAAGIVLSKTPITRTVPCTWDKDKNGWKTQICKEEVEQIGLIKLDLLGIKTGVDIRDAARLIKKRHGIDYFTNWEKIINDLPAMVGDAYVKCDTTSIFQMNTPVAVDLLRKVKVMKDPVRDIAAYTSALRPGPMSAGVHNDLVDTINGVKEEEYLHESLIKYLQDTYGHLIYQEQVMQICIDLGGFTKFEADKIRKAMGKKLTKIIDKFGEKFIKHAVEVKGIPRSIAKEIWDNMAAFAEYGFNKSHAICYSAVSTICMYFKTKYPLEWMAACLGRVSREDSESAKKNYKRYYREWKSYMRNPDINNSGEEYEIIEDKIYMPLYASKSIKKDTALQVGRRKPFIDFDDVVYKTKSDGMGRKDLIEALVYSGACDSFKNDINQLKFSLNEGDEVDRAALEMLVDFNLEMNNKDYSELLETKEEAMDLLGLSEEGSDDFAKKVIDSGILDTKINKFSFRRYLIIRYYAKLKYLTIKKPVKDLMKERNETYYSKLYPIYRNRNLDHLFQKDYGKYNLVSNKGINKAIKDNPGKNDLIEANDIRESLTKMHDKEILMKELDFLNFTSFDFGKMYKNEISAICERKNLSTPLPMNKIIDIAEGINIKIEKLKEGIKASIKSEDNSTSAGAIKNGKNIAYILTHISAVFGKWQLSGIVADMEYNLERISPVNRVNILLAIQNEITGNKAIPWDLLNKFTISRQIKNFLDKKHVYVLSKVLYSKTDVRDANSTRILEYTPKDLLNLVKFGHMVENGDQEIELDLRKDKRLSEIAGKINYTKKGAKEAILQTVVELGSNSLFRGLLEKTKDNGRDYSIYSLNDREKALVLNDNYVFGSMFKPEKKHYQKEFTDKSGNTTKVMNLILADGDSQLMLNIKNFDKMSVMRNIKTPFIDTVRDFTPMMLPVKLSFNLRREGYYNLKFDIRSAQQITYVQDYL